MEKPYISRFPYRKLFIGSLYTAFVIVLFLNYVSILFNKTVYNISQNQNVNGIVLTYFYIFIIVTYAICIVLYKVIYIYIYILI